MFKKVNGESSAVKATGKKVTTNGIEFMINTAIMSLDNPSGSSVVAITKQIGKMYDIDGDATSKVIKHHIRESVGDGRLVQTTGSGLAGSFKLSLETSKKIERELKTTNATMSKAKKTPEADGSKKTAAVKIAPSKAVVSVKKVAAAKPKLDATKTKTVEKAAPVKKPKEKLEIEAKKPVPKNTVSSAKKTKSPVPKKGKENAAPAAAASTSAASKTLQLKGDPCFDLYFQKMEAKANTPSKAAVNVKKVLAAKLDATKTKTVEKAAPVKKPTKDREAKKPVPKKTVSSARKANSPVQKNSKKNIAPATAPTSAARKSLQLNKKEESWTSEEESEDSDDSLVPAELTSTVNKSRRLSKKEESWISEEDSEDSDSSWCDWNGGKNNSKAKNVSDYQNCHNCQNGGKPKEKSCGAPPRFKIYTRM